MVTLAPLDWAVVALFFGAILALGFSARLRENTALQFIAAGRSLTLPVFVATLVSTWYGGILGMGESVQSYGLGTWVMLGLPYYVFALVYALVYARRVRDADQISIPERLEHRFGRKVALIGAGLIFLLGVPAAHVLMLGVLAQAVTGWPLALCVVVGTLVGTLFLYRGGLMADARVSLLAFVMMYVGFIVIVGYCLATHPLAQTWASIPNRDLFKWDGNQGALTVVSFFILGAWTLIDPGFHQRVASAADREVGRRGILVSILFWMFFDLLTISTGMYAIALMPTPPQEPLLIFPLFGEQILPPGLKALFFCGMLGTILTAMVGYSLVSGATLGREVVARLRPNATEPQVTLWSRWGIAGACLVAIVLALQIQSVVALWYSWSGAVIGAMLVPMSMSYGLLRRVRTSRTVIALSMLVAFASSVAWMAYGYSHGNQYLMVTLNLGGREQQFGLGTLAPGFAISALIVAIGALFGGKTGHERLAD